MKSIHRTLFLLGFFLFSATSSVVVQPSAVPSLNVIGQPHAHVDGYCPCRYLPLAYLGNILLVVSFVTTFISAFKLIKAFAERHDYASNFIKEPHTIASYSITAHATTHKKMRSSLRSSIVETKIFYSESDFKKIVKECAAWSNAADQELLIVLQPSISLHSDETYSLKKYVLRYKERTHTEKLLTDVFYVPESNTRYKKIALWSGCLALSATLTGALWKTLNSFSANIF